ncbi:hypothetical protein BDQ17DRAFT_1356350, partial [Cyathus striatus]
MRWVWVMVMVSAVRICVLSLEFSILLIFIICGHLYQGLPFFHKLVVHRTLCGLRQTFRRRMLCLMRKMRTLVLSDISDGVLHSHHPSVTIADNKGL